MSKYYFLNDILPTGYFAAYIANVEPEDDVAVFGEDRLVSLQLSVHF